MKVYCKNGHDWLVHTGHYWRYHRSGPCPECGEKGKPNKEGRNHLKKRSITADVCSRDISDESMKKILDQL